MIKDTYEYNSIPNKTVFIFYSEGKKGKIKKGIIFTKMGGNLWNLAFGDEKRKKLYNHIFRRHYEDINLLFHITGIYLDSEKEDYSPQKNYDFFRLKRKFVK